MMQLVLLLCFIASPLLAMQKALPVEKPSLTVSLSGQQHTLDLTQALAHCRSYHLKSKNGTRKISGFHAYTLPPQEKITQIHKGTLIKLKPSLWIYTQGNSQDFHRGYIIYQGTAYDKPKTFFPCTFNQQALIERIKQATQIQVKESAKSTRFVKHYKIEARNGKQPPLTFIITGSSSTGYHIRTFYPCLQQVSNPNIESILQQLAKEQATQIKQSTCAKKEEPLLLKVTQAPEMSYLLEQGADPNIQNDFGTTPLMLAAQRGDIDSIITLFEHEANPLICDKEGNSVIRSAIRSKDYYTVMTFFHPTLINQANKEGITPLMTAVQLQQPEVLQLILSFCSNLDASDNTDKTALMHACISGTQESTIELLLEHKPHLDLQDLQGDTALHHALYAYNEGAITQLLDAGADYTLKNKRGKSALDCATKHKYEHLFTQKREKERKWIWDYQANSFLYACFQGNPHKIRRLLDQEPDIHTKTNDKSSALYFAALHGLSDIVELLLKIKKGADPYDAQGLNLTPELKAIIDTATANLEQQKKQENDARKQEELERRKKALKYFSDTLSGNYSFEDPSILTPYINSKINSQGHTPLLHAVAKGKHVVAKKLLTINDIRVHARGKDGLHALDVALDNHDHQMITILCPHFNQPAILECLKKAQLSECSIILRAKPDCILPILKASFNDESLAQARGIIYDQQLLACNDATITEFFNAITTGNKPFVALLLKLIPDLALKLYQQKTALQVAVETSQLPIVQLLCPQYVPLEQPLPQGGTILNCLPQRGEIKAYLMGIKATQDASKAQALQKQKEQQIEKELQAKGYTDRMIAAHLNNAAAITFTADNPIAGPQGLTALMIATQRGHLKVMKEIVRVFPQELDCQDATGFTALLYALKCKQTVLARFLLEQNADVLLIAQDNGKGSVRALGLAQGQGNLPQLIQETALNQVPAYCTRLIAMDPQERITRLQREKQLLALISSQQWKIAVMSYLVRYNQQEALEQFLKNAFIKPTEKASLIKDLPQILKEGNELTQRCLVSMLKPDPSLLLACWKLDPQIISHIIDVLPMNNTAQLRLISTCLRQKEADLTFIEYLAKHCNTNLNEPLEQEGSLLALCCRKDLWEALELLLHLGADPSIHCGTSGETLLHTAVQLNNAEKLTRLLSLIGVSNVINAKATKNDQGLGDFTPLHWAVHHKCNPAILQILLDHGADINQSTGYCVEISKMTPLGLALHQNNPEIVAFLLDHRAPVYGNNNRCAPLEQAQSPECVELLLAKKAPMNELRRDGMTPLQSALFDMGLGLSRVFPNKDKFVRNKKIALLLIKNGACVNNYNDSPVLSGMTPLHMALCDTHGHTEIAEVLLEHGADANAPSRYKETSKGWSLQGARALHFVLLHGDNCCAFIQKLKQHGADVNATTAEGATALHMAVAQNLPTVVKELISLGANVHQRTSCQKYKGMNALDIACKNRNHEIMEILIKQGIDPNATMPEGDYTGYCPLHLICATKTLKYDLEVEVFLGDSVQMLPSEWLLEPIMKLLLDHQAHIDNPINQGALAGMTPLHIALEHQNFKLASILVSKGAECHKPIPYGICKDLTPLHVAIEKSNTNLLTTLIGKGADCTIPCKDFTPFARAIEARYSKKSFNRPESLDIIRILLEAGCNPDQQTNGPGPALLCATHQDDAELITLLLAHKANINSQCYQYRLTALHMALAKGNIYTAYCLLVEGANSEMRVPEQNKISGGMTPLHIALTTENFCLKCINYLLEYKANVHAVVSAGDYKGMTPLQLARQSNRPQQVIDLLMKAGAKD